MSNDLTYSEIISLMRENGVSLRHLGSGEYGLKKLDAIRVVRGLCKNGITPLGIELWKRSGDSYWLEADLGWYASTAMKFEECCKSAINYINGESVGGLDLVTIQFDGDPTTPE